MDYSEDAERFYLNEENKKKRKENFYLKILNSERKTW